MIKNNQFQNNSCKCPFCKNNMTFGKMGENYAVNISQKYKKESYLTGRTIVKRQGYNTFATEEEWATREVADGPIKEQKIIYTYNYIECPYCKYKIIYAEDNAFYIDNKNSQLDICAVMDKFFKIKKKIEYREKYKNSDSDDMRTTETAHSYYVLNGYLFFNGVCKYLGVWPGCLPKHEERNLDPDNKTFKMMVYDKEEKTKKQHIIIAIGVVLGFAALFGLGWLISMISGS